MLEEQNYGYISAFKVNLSCNLQTHIFEDADVAWLHCVATHRKKMLFTEIKENMESFDVIVGKIADDATNATLTTYLSGAFGIAGDKEAEDFL